MVKNGTNPNFNLIDVLPEKKNIDINQIRNLINIMQKSTFNNKPRFILIDNIDLLNLNSINALLKFLEEPNENIYFILIHNNTKILPYSKSRCLNFKLFLLMKVLLSIANKIIKKNILNLINIDLLNYYVSPGKIYELLRFSDVCKIDLKELSLKELLKK